MTSRTKVSRRTPSIRRSRLIRCVTEALEDRKLMAADLVTVGIGGAAANGDSGEASVSADGRYVVFSSFASNLVTGDTNGKRDVFLRDRQAGTTTLLSKVPGSGEIGNGDSTQPVISQDGNFVAFVTQATNLIASDTLGFRDVVRYNVQTGALELVSKNNAGGFANGGSSEPTISENGNFVSFTTFGANVADTPAFSDGNAANDVIVRNMTTGSNKLVSVSVGGVAAGNNLSFDSWISSNGRFITFRSDASNLVSGDTNNNRDTFLRDTGDPTATPPIPASTKLISANPSGASGNSGSESNAVSGDGLFVVFQSKATDLVNNDGNNNTDVFLRNVATNTTRLLSVNKAGTSSAGGFSEFPALSQDGSYATFSSTAPDIVDGDTNGREDVFLRDLARGPLTLISRNTANAPSNGRSFDPFLSRNGDFVVFTSNATDLVGGVATGGTDNIFIVNTPPPNTTTDTVPPTATFGGVLPINPGAMSVDFTVNLADNVGLDTVGVGPLTLTRQGDNATFTANLVSVVGTGTSAVATYRVTFPSAVEANAGTYSVSAAAGAIKDVAGNSFPAGLILGGSAGAGQTFAITQGNSGNPGGPGGGAIGDPNGPNLILITPGKVPAEVIGGNKKGKFKFKMQNTGPGTLTNVQTEFKVYLSADQNVDAGDTNVSTISKFFKKLKVTKAKAITGKFTFPTTIGDGNFFVLAQADTANAVAESNESDNAVPSATAVLVRQPFVDLQPTLVNKPSKVTPGLAGTTTVVIKNNGNVPFKSSTPLELVLTTNGSVDDSATTLTTITPVLTIKNGKTKTVKFNVTLPAGLAAGAYQLGLDVDATNAVAESDEGNNLATSFIFNV